MGDWAQTLLGQAGRCISRHHRLVRQTVADRDTRSRPDRNKSGIHLQPERQLQAGDNEHVLTIPPGPNGPAGSVWIELLKPTYGIYDTPDPSKIGKTESHGCVPLTKLGRL